jgi:uncharacterized membrane protein YgaE (UPF0421/DUF939 family)
VLTALAWHKRPAVVQITRSTSAAVLAYLAALWLTSHERPLLAPLTAVLVVQVTLYATLTVGLRRIVSVVAGVLLALTFAALLGFSWWSLGILIAASLSLGRLLRVTPFVEEVAISGMFILGVGSESTIGLGRVVEHSSARRSAY